MPKTKKTKLRNKFMYVQDWGSYSNETLVCVNMTVDEILKESKKIGPVTLKQVEEWAEKIKKNAYDCRGFVIEKEGKTLLWLEHWGKWTDVNVLVHETNHMIHFVMLQGKKMWDEMEAQAYQHEYLFDKISAKLSDNVKTH